MKTSAVIQVTATVLGLAIAGVAQAVQEQEQRFPTVRSQPLSCSAVSWSEEMLQNHPGLIDACREVVIVDGRTWARFEAKFVRAERNGQVAFSVRDRTDRSVEQVLLTVVPGQVAYINDRAMPFRQLRSSDIINLYVPENEYGFATRPGVPSDMLATVSAAPEAEAVELRLAVTQRDPLPGVLPRTASQLPFLGIMGLCALLSGICLSVLRRRSYQTSRAPAK